MKSNLKRTLLLLETLCLGDWEHPPAGVGEITLKDALERGLIEQSDRPTGRHFRWRITAAGQEFFLTHSRPKPFHPII